MVDFLKQRSAFHGLGRFSNPKWETFILGAASKQNAMGAKLYLIVLSICLLFQGHSQESTAPSKFPMCINWEGLVLCGKEVGKHSEAQLRRNHTQCGYCLFWDVLLFTTTSE